MLTAHICSHSVLLLAAIILALHCEILKNDVRDGLGLREKDNRRGIDSNV